MKIILSVNELKKIKKYCEWFGDQEVLLLYTEEGVRAYSGMCPHQGGPLGEGYFNGKSILCPWHGCSFNAINGKCISYGTCLNLSGGMALTPLPIKIENGEIYVEI